MLMTQLANRTTTIFIGCVSDELINRSTHDFIIQISEK